MGPAVVGGASIKCSMGQGPGVLNATSQSVCIAGGKPVVIIKDTAPFLNVGSCGMCISMMNPAVASATAAALGVLTPQPCAASVMGMWSPGSKVIMGGAPCVTGQSMLTCAYGGILSITAPGQNKVLV